jgi:protein TonB
LPATEGVDADGLRSYRLALAREAKRHKRFPTRAIEAGWNGTAEVRILVSADGIAPDARLAKSSGHDVLDEAALDMLRNALPTTPVPPSLRGRTFVVDLPVVFELPQ